LFICKFFPSFSSDSLCNTCPITIIMLPFRLPMTRTTEKHQHTRSAKTSAQPMHDHKYCPRVAVVPPLSSVDVIVVDELRPSTTITSTGSVLVGKSAGMNGFPLCHPWT
jgi:hypothetical protein